MGLKMPGMGTLTGNVMTDDDRTLLIEIRDSLKKIEESLIAAAKPDEYLTIEEAGKMLKMRSTTATYRALARLKVRPFLPGHYRRDDIAAAVFFATHPRSKRGK
jgi:hypothetical protein